MREAGEVGSLGAMEDPVLPLSSPLELECKGKRTQALIVAADDLPWGIHRQLQSGTWRDHADLGSSCMWPWINHFYKSPLTPHPYML